MVHTACSSVFQFSGEGLVKVVQLGFILQNLKNTHSSKSFPSLQDTGQCIKPQIRANS